MRCLITGAAGFVGRHLAAALTAEGHDVFGTDRSAPTDAGDLAVETSRFAVATLDDVARLTAVVHDVQPTVLFHLAAFTSPAASFDDPAEVYRTNLHGSLHVFAAVRSAVPACRVVWIGSSDAYGLVRAEELPVGEQQLFRPLSPYAVSKAAADLAAFQWSRAYRLDVVRLRPFNHTGPGQAAHFVCADFARQVVAVERRLQPPRIAVGNLDVARDFSDVRDVVRAYIAAWHRGEPGEAYNVCSGVARTPGDIVHELLRLSGVTASVEPDPARQRPVDVPRLVGSAAKLHAATGWAPQIAWTQTLRDLLDDWRQRLGEPGDP
jgi:GDP-4-dehydro-6-deoxy-D-mannose reductase